MMTTTHVAGGHMARIPLTVREQLLTARDLGHVLSVETRGPWPEHGDPHPKYFVTCTCGYRGKAAARSRRGASFYVVGHLGRVIGLEEQARTVNGG